MAKRKRLSPPRSDFLGEKDTNPAESDSEALETKSMFPMGVAQSSGASSVARTPRAPIAQVAGEAAASAALSEMSDMIAKARAEGRIVESLSLSEVDLGHLVRDRVYVHGEDFDALKASLQARGQQVPVEVVDRGAEHSPRFGLISGWRRMLALSEIGASDVLAVVRQPQDATEAYVAMVEENEIRSDISFYERARIVVKALEQGVYSDPKAALQSLFSNVSRAKRSKIKSFMALVEALDGALAFPAAISERNGLELVKRFNEDPSRVSAVKARLTHDAPGSAEAEMAVLLGETSPVPAPLERPEDVLEAASNISLPSPSRPVGAQVDAQAPVDVAFDSSRNEIALRGAGVDEGLVRDLKRWLSKRS